VALDISIAYPIQIEMYIFVVLINIFHVVGTLGPRYFRTKKMSGLKRICDIIGFIKNFCNSSNLLVTTFAW